VTARPGSALPILAFPLAGFVAAGLALAGLASAQAPAPAEPVETPKLSVEIAPLTIAVGDRVEAVLTLRAGAGLSGPPSFPVWEEHWGDAEILATELPMDEGGGVWRQRLSLTVFATGLATLPAVEVRVPRAEETLAATSPAQVIEVRSVLPEDEAEAVPRPPDAVRALPVGGGFWWVVAILGLGCLVLAYFVWRKASEIGRTLASLALSPFEALGKALERLRRETDAERLVTGLSLELRRYLGRAVGFRAAEGTTTEVQRGLREGSLPPELVRETMSLLREADRIKFGRGAADRDWAGRRLEDAAALSERVEDWLRPAAEPEHPAEANS
jgi:hypothetical protein